MTPCNAMIATYRVQLTPQFGFAQTRELLPYLESLGISHLYLSPIFQARAGSTHGYDQTNPTSVRTELGGESGFRALVADAQARHRGVLVDIVPNHLAAHHDNPWWWQLLAGGPSCEANRFFDVDWEAGGGRIILPCLGRPLPEALAAGELTVVGDARAARLRYFDRLFPIRPDGPRGVGRPTLELLSGQHYELAFWRDGLERINYRRFFDIADLPAVRVEDPLVFEATHAGLFRLAAEGLIDGVRVDHIDGLLDPLAYLRRLRKRLRECRPAHEAMILVEKVLAPGEALPEHWPVDGTTGYEYIAGVTQLLAVPEGVRRIRESCHAGPQTFHETALDCKRLVARTFLAPELNRLVSLLAAILQSQESASLRQALVEVSAQLPVYRTYADASGLSAKDRRLISEASEHARRARPAHAASIQALEQVLLGDEPWTSLACLDFRRRWQQFTGPLAAKGIEDTALYRDTAFLALNEVGSEPEPSPDAEDTLRAALAQRRDRTCSLNPGATHDTKRGEDARARLAVLSLLPERWISLVNSWADIPGAICPSERLLVFQTLWAIWPEVQTDPDQALHRVSNYLQKALREAKLNSSWLNPNAPYEATAGAFARRLLTDPSTAFFRQDLDQLDTDLAHAITGATLLSVLLRILAPGVPDVYQGSEFPDRSLADPDNRRLPDFVRRRRMLQEIHDAWRASPVSLARRLASPAAGEHLKPFVYWRALSIRSWLLESETPIAMRALTVRAARNARLISWTANAGTRQALVMGLILPPDGGLSLRDVWPHPFPRAVEQLSGRDLSADESAAMPLPAAIFLSEDGTPVSRIEESAPAAL